MADILSLVKALKDKATAQYEKGAPYRQALASALKGDIQGINQSLSKSDLTPMDFALMMGTSGIGGKLPKTQFEVAHELAQQRAALPISEGGLGLPANNTAMDRANAMGYTTPAYHGTTKSFNEFNPQKRGSATDKGWYGPGEYSAPNPTAADAYIMNDWLDYKNGGNIMPLLLKDAEQIPNKFGNITEYVTRNPNQIRSINAAFDPFRRNEADILAGVGALPFIDYKKDKK